MRKSSVPKIIKVFFMKQNLFVYKKGETIIRQGDEPSGVYFVEKGFVKAYSISIVGEEKFYFIYKKNEIFPLGWVINDTKNQTQFEALSKTVLRRCSKAEFLEFLDQENTSTVEFSKYLVDKISLYAQRLSNLETTSSYPRIIIYLIFIAKRLGRENNGKITFDLQINQVDIANSVNVTRETASKELTKLRDKKLIDSSRSTLEIIDLNGLKNELDNYYKNNY